MRWPGIGRLLGRGEVEVRVYVIQARGLASKDGISKADALTYAHVC